MHARRNNTLFSLRSLCLGLMATLTAAAGLTAAPILVTQHHQIYTQNFDSLGTVDQPWVNDATLPAWHLQRRVGTTTTLFANSGGGGSLNHFNYGSTGATDRALGGVAATNVNNGIAWGVQITNSSAQAIGAIDVTFDGEQWRRDGSVAHDINFYYRVGGVSFDLQTNPGAWTAVTSLRFHQSASGWYGLGTRWQRRRQSPGGYFRPRLS